MVCEGQIYFYSTNALLRVDVFIYLESYNLMSDKEILWNVKIVALR